MPGKSGEMKCRISEMRSFLTYKVTEYIASRERFQEWYYMYSKVVIRIGLGD